MKQPGHIWLGFIICLALILPTMGWLTYKAIELDALRAEDYRNTELARREAQLQERISSALWRLDWVLTSVIAAEVARPFYLYDSFYAGPNSHTDVADPSNLGFANFIPSPLLLEKKPFVKLHFQIEANNRFSSPTCPPQEQFEYALTCGADSEWISNACDALDVARRAFNFQQLLEKSSSTLIPYGDTTYSLPENQGGQSYSVSQILLQNSPGLENVFDQSVLNNSESDTQQAQSPTNKLDFQRNIIQQRANVEQQARNRATLAIVGNEFKEKMRLMTLNQLNDGAKVNEGVMRPVWVGEHLLLLRYVDFVQQRVVQCCWLDRTEIEKNLLSQVSDLLPHARLSPIYDMENPPTGRALATLPYEIVADLSNLPPNTNESLNDAIAEWSSGLRLSLWLAWCGLFLGASAIGLLLHGVIKLSERRAAFVSAVTHELRTPLTTFRMYAEMLADKMLPSDEKRQEYANTLRVESNRLSHLVENVLQFARLERGFRGGQRQSILIGDLVADIETRLQNRVDESKMQLVTEIDLAVAKTDVETIPSAIEHVIFNLIDNACKYAGDADDRRIHLTCSIQGKQLVFSVRDHGKGVHPCRARELFKPFRKSDQQAANSANGVGLGLALCTKLARDLKGVLCVDSSVTDGAKFDLKIPLR
ncbi:MAG TPA: HAMP domain-containing sensor histidine kinase [Pirellulaceae bacterium]|mgnify:CR=1 FL=1|nr:HAMP domain-containing sensor histidine kinase [Pirellulaceae bacterium]HMO92038.1 HAMP domain-containing sensor histidine kinase [Pirellulaceae bacterium]HMP68837.1 HAMP domain-containing sensor histidine kinase [Pirellulaceae bacterium]